MVRQFYKALKKFLKDRGSQISFPVDFNMVRMEALSHQALIKPEQTNKKFSVLYKNVSNETLKNSMNTIIKNIGSLSTLKLILINMCRPERC